MNGQGRSENNAAIYAHKSAKALGVPVTELLE
jgi:hypothetical protein